MRHFQTIMTLFAVAGLGMCASTTCAQVAATDSDPETTKKEGMLFASLNQAEMVFTAKVTDVVYGPVAQSFPPIYYMTLSLREEDFFRGKKPSAMKFGYSIRQKDKPEFDRDKVMLVAASRSANRDGRLQVSLIVPADDRKIGIARNAVSMPLGWQFTKAAICPWAKIKDWKWPKRTDLNAMIKCSVTGRPALMAGENIKVSVEQIIPKDAHKFQNPFGDGRFKVSVTNVGKTKAEVPALLADGDEILWANSLVIVDRGQPRILPSARKFDQASAVTLEPNESVSTEINVLPIDAVQWPRGGSRVYFQFCLGEKSASSFFYYFSRRHDKLRDAAKKRAPRQE